MNIEQIMQLLPHRSPFLMVDRVLKIEGNRIIGVKNVTMNEPYFQGHFPGHPIMPGVLQLEAMAQVAGHLMIKQRRERSATGLFHVRRGCQMAQTGVPGDVLIIEVELTKCAEKSARPRAFARCAAKSSARRKSPSCSASLIDCHSCIPFHSSADHPSQGAASAPVARSAPTVSSANMSRWATSCRLHSHVVIDGHTQLGRENEIFPSPASG